MVTFSLDDINNLEHIYKINLINSCSGYKSANLIGTQDSTGLTNVAIFSSVIHLGSNPPLMGFITRPTTVTRHTYDNIKSTRKYTLNHVHQSIIKEAHHTSAKYDKTISEFNCTSLEEEFINNFEAPFVKNAPIQMAMEYVEEYPIEANGTILVIGKIKALHIKDNLLEDDGFINLSKGNVATINGLDGYAVPQLQERLDYQRPKPEFENQNG